jgi:ATP-dependent DNA ligase
MLAKAVSTIPVGDGLTYEPKWDGFRTIVVRERGELELASRNERPLTPYFPEVCEALAAQLPDRCVLDGEIVIAGPSGLDFEALLARIHPAASRVRRLAAETPASFVAFDLLALGDDDYRQRPFAERRAKLEDVLVNAVAPVHVTPATTDASLAADWLKRFEGAGLDGVVAKDSTLPYVEDKRVMFKIKHARTADCVVGGYRPHASKPGVGSLLLGLYDTSRHLAHVGVTATFTDAVRLELLDTMEPLRVPDGADHPWRPGGDGTRRPGPPTRWSSGKNLDFEAVRPELVCEVAYDHMQGDRFRHTTRFVRWRPDKAPTSCTYDQLEVVVPVELGTIFGAS